MKSLIIYIFAFVALCAGLTSCVSTKKIIYFQGSDSLFKDPQKIAQLYDLRIKPADRISVSLSCSDAELLAPFAQNITLGTAFMNAKTGMMSSGSGNQDVYIGYTVDKQGYITLPVIGKVKAEGFTEQTLAKEIQNKIIASGYIKDPQVTVKFTNARVSVLGAVNRPGQINLNSQRNSILDILSMAGDIADYGLKTNVKLFREVNGERKMYTLDMTKDSVFNSPAFYVQQNDLIYVQPNKAAIVKNSPFFTFWSASASIVSLLMSITTFAIAISK